MPIFSDTSVFDAGAWVDAIRWHASLISSRSLRLYRRGLPRAELKAVVEELARRSPAPSILLASGEELVGPWHFAPATWRRDSGDREARGDDTFTLLLSTSLDIAGEGVAFDESCSSRVHVRYEWDKPFVETLPGPPAPGVVQRIGGASRNPETNLWDYYVETRTALVQTLVEHVSSASPLDTTESSAKLSVRVAPDGTLSDENGGAVAIPSAGLANGVLVEHRRRKNDDCTTDIQVDKTTAKALDPAGSAHSRDKLAHTDSVDKVNQASELAAVDLGPGGEITEVSSRINKFGLWDTQTNVITPKAVDPSGESHSRDALSETDGTTKANQALPQAAVALGPNHEITETRSEINKHGLWDIQTNVITPRAVDPSGESHSRDALSETDGTTKANQALPQAAVALGPNHEITETRSEINRFGLWDTQTNVITPKAVDPSGKSHSRDKLAHTDGVTKANQAAPQAAVALSPAGVLTETRSEINRHGLWDIQTSVTVPQAVDPSAKGFSEEKFQSVEETSRANQANRQESVALSDGKITAVRSEINRFGLWDQQKSETLGLPVRDSGASKEVSALVTTVGESHTNQPGFQSYDIPPARGTIVQLTDKVNRFGLVDQERITRVASEDGFATASGGPLYADSEEVRRNGRAVPSPGAGGVGTLTSVSGSVNEFGLYDSRVSTRTAKSMNATFTAGGELFSDTETVTRNSPTPENPGAGAAGTLHQASNSINEFGLFDTHKTVRTAKTKNVTSAYGGPLVNISQSITRNNTSEADPGAGVAGTIKDASNSINEFGLFDTVLTTQAAVAQPPLIYTWSEVRGGESRPHIATRYTNISTIPAIPDSTRTNAVHAEFHLNQFGLYDGTVTQTPRFGPLTGASGDSLTFQSGPLERSEMHTEVIDGTLYRIQETYEYEVRAYTRDASGDCRDGWAFYDGGMHGSSYQISRRIMTFTKVTGYRKKFIREEEVAGLDGKEVADDGPGS